MFRPKCSSLAWLALFCIGCSGAPDDVGAQRAALTGRQNWALNKPATQSSDPYGGPPGRAVDGNTSGVWANGSVAHTGADANAWWQVDLQAVVAIENVEIWGRTDPCCTDRLSNYYVLVSTDPFTSTDLQTTLKQPGVYATQVTGTSQLPVQMLDVGRTGRYVRVQLGGTNYLQLAEVGVYGNATLPTGTGASCSLPSSASTVCAGPWKFATLVDPCTRYLPPGSDACPTYTDYNSPQYPSCADHAFGCDPGSSNGDQVNYSIQLPHHYQKRCSKLSRTGDCMIWVNDLYVDRSCSDTANDNAVYWQNQLTSTTQNGCYWPNASDVYGPGAGLSSNGWITCTFIINNQPKWKTGNGPQCGAPSYPTKHSDCYVSNVGQCGDNAGSYYSASGLDVSTLATYYPVPANTETNSSPPQVVYDSSVKPTCLTCDDLPLGNDADSVNAKAKCLLTPQFPALDSTTAAAVVEANRRSAMLLLELHGDLLNDTYRPQIEALYVSDQGATPQCGLAWTVTPPTATCSAAFSTAPAFSQSDWDHLNADMALCIRLGDSHVAAQVKTYYAQRCLGELPDLIAKLPSACDKTPFEQQFEGLAMKLLNGQLSGASFNFTDPSQRDKTLQQIAGELGTIDDWYTDQVSIQGATNDLTVDMNKVLASFWSGVNPGFGALNTSNPISADALSQAAATEIESYREVLLSLFSSPTPMTSTPLLYLFGDGLQPIWERLTDAILYHDLGCRYADCLATRHSDEMTNMWAVLAAIHDKSALKAQIDTFSNNTSFIPRDWQAVWLALYQNHAVFENAVLAALGTPNATYSPSLITATPSTQLPPSLVRLQKIILDAQVRTTNFNATGSLSGQMTNVLRTGIEKSQQQQVGIAFGNAIAALETSRSTFDKNRNALLQALVAQVGNAGQQTALGDRINQQLSDYDDADRQILALQHNTEVDDQHFGDFLSAWKLRSQSPAVTNAYQVDAYKPFPVTPAQARHAAGATDYPYNVSVLVDKTITDVPVDGSGAVAIPVNKGEMLHLKVSGAWAPTCAFKSVTWPNPPFTQPLQPDPTSLIGPDGYMMSNDTSIYKATGKDQSDSSYHSTTLGDGSVQFCLNTTVGVDSGIGHAFGVVASITASTNICQGWSWGGKYSETTSNTSGDNNTQSMQFTSGLRLPVNPFPDFPTGALLLVQVPKNQVKASHVQVVRASDTGMVIDADSTVYLVVNDVAGCAVSSAQGGLQVTLARMIPATQLAAVLAPMMADELQTLRNGKLDASGKLVRNGMAQWVAAGAFLPGDRQTLASAALDDLRNALTGLTDPSGNQQYTLETIPGELLSLYTTRVDYELDRIERAVQIQNLRQKQKTIMLAMQELRDELASTQDQSRLITLEARWAMQSMDGDGLRANTVALTRYLSDYIYPIVRVRYTGLLDRNGASGFFTNGQLTPELQALVDVDWRDELYGQATKVSSAASAVKRIFEAAEATYPPVGVRPAILSIPRPEAAAACQNSPLCGLSNYEQIDLTRATKFWADLDSTGIANLQIRPEDVYRLMGGNAVLACSWASPVVQSMQVFFNIGTDPANYGSLHIAPMQALGDLTFTSDEGAETYVMGDPNWLTGSGSVLFGQPQDVESSINNLLNSPAIHGGFGEGLSPFMTWRFDMRNYLTQSSNPADVHPLVANLQEMVVVFETEYRTAAAGVGYVGSCH